MWDTAGQEKFRALAKAFYKKAQGCIVCFDMTSRESFESVKNTWVSSMGTNCVEGVATALFGCKSDLTDQIVVERSEAEKVARDNGMQYFETSSKMKQGVEEAF